MRQLALLFLINFMLFIACENKDGITNSKETPVLPNDFLSDKKYDNLIIEIQYVEGFAPTGGALTNLQNFLNQRLNKPGGITIIQNSIPSPGKSTYSADDIRNIERLNRTLQHSDKTLTAYFFFADGDYANNTDNGKVLGIAYGASSMAVFEKTVKEFSGTIGKPSTQTLESTVLLHEFGHILGLVNNGTPMASHHQDEEHGKHCNDENCLMYYATETTAVVGNLMGGSVPQLTASCIEDLQGNGGK